MPGHAAEQAGPRIVDFAGQQAAVQELGGSRAGAEPMVRVEGGIGQSERAEEQAAEVAVEWLAADAADHLAEQDETGVAVLESRTGRVVEAKARERPRRLRETQTDGVLGRDSAEARAVREDPADRHVPELATPEFAQIGTERRVEPEPVPLDQCHDRERGAEGLRQRGDVEDGVLGHRLRVRDHLAPAEGTVIEDVVRLADDDHGAGNLAGRDDRLHRLVDGGEFGGLGEPSGGKQSQRDRAD